PGHILRAMLRATRERILDHARAHPGSCADASWIAAASPAMTAKNVTAFVAGSAVAPASAPRLVSRLAPLSASAWLAAWLSASDAWRLPARSAHRPLCRSGLPLRDPAISE